MNQRSNNHFLSLCILAAQFSGLSATIMLSVLICCSALWFGIFGPKKLQTVKLRIHYCIVLLILLSHCLLVSLFDANEENLTTRLHLLFYMVLYLSMVGFNLRPPHRLVCHLIVFFNLAVLLTALSAPNINSLWTSHHEMMRFKSYFSEPAHAAIMYAILMTLILQSPILSWMAVASLLAAATCLWFTYSGSGLALAGTAILFFLRRRFSVSMSFFIVGTLLVLIASSGGFDGIILKRASNIASFDISFSTYYRFIAPFLTAKTIFENPVDLLYGIGVGNLEYVIVQNRDLEQILYNPYLKEVIPVLNNAYVIFLLWYGLPAGFFGIVAVLGKVFGNSRLSTELKALIVIYPFFTGHVLSPLTLLIFLLGSMQPRYRSSRHEKSCA